MIYLVKFTVQRRSYTINSLKFFDMFFDTNKMDRSLVLRDCTTVEKL